MVVTVIAWVIQIINPHANHIYYYKYHLLSKVIDKSCIFIITHFIQNPDNHKGMFKMSENTIKNSELEEMGITIQEQLLETGIQDEYADKIAADYIEKLANARHDKDSVLYKSFEVKEYYRKSDLHKSINRIINQLEPLRVALVYEKLAFKQAVAEGNAQVADESMKVVAKKKLERSKLEQKLNVLIGSINKLQFAS